METYVSATRPPPPSHRAFVQRIVRATARALVPDFISAALIIRALHVYLLIWPGVFRAHLCAAFPLFSPLLLSAARTRAYIIRSIRYLMAVSVSDVYPTLRSSPPWPGREVSLSNLRFPRASRCVQRERAHECTRFTVLGASDVKRSFFPPVPSRDRFEI